MFEPQFDEARRRASPTHEQERPMQRPTMKLIAHSTAVALALCACATQKAMPIDAGSGTAPALPKPDPSLIPTVHVAKATGWPMFFVICMLVAIPSLILLAWLQRRGHFDEVGPVKV
jgi:hypothetical protein